MRLVSLRRDSESSRERKKASIYALSALVGTLSGLIIVGYRSVITFLEQNRTRLAPSLRASLPSLAIWLAVAAILGLVVARLVKAAPLIKGSGIPQVKASLMRRISLGWKRELPFKFIGGSLALGVGCSLGREGPSIQLGALVGEAVGKASRKGEYARYLVTAGAAAGISAAFNAPLAGVLFCLEELHRNVSPAMLTSSLIASFCANAVMWAFYGSQPVFGLALTNALPLQLYFTAIVMIGAASGVLGSLFNRGLLAFQEAYKRLCPDGTLRIVSAFVVAGAVGVFLPLLAGGGDRLIEAVGGGRFPLGVIALLLAGKTLFTLFCYASGAPGGIFLPMLAIGALIGSASDSLLSALGGAPGYLNNYILIGMVGFFTAVVRAPITGAVLITEMAGSFSHFPAFIFVSVIASLVSSALRTKPIYDSLLAQIAPDNAKQRTPDDNRPVTLHVPVLEGSVLETSEHVQERLPEGCILACVERGEEEVFPRAGLDIQPGDVLCVVVEKGNAAPLKERLMALGRARADTVEHDGE